LSSPRARFIPVEIGDDVGNHFTGDKKIVPGEQGFGHDVTIIAIVPEAVLGSRIIKAIDFGEVFIERQVVVFPYG
jgi:hypothetical protein